MQPTEKPKKLREKMNKNTAIHMERPIELDKVLFVCVFLCSVSKSLNRFRLGPCIKCNAMHNM